MHAATDNSIKFITTLYVQKHLYLVESVVLRAQHIDAFAVIVTMMN